MHVSVRARDADRSAVVEALTEAYVDGQLSATEREARVDAALGTVHLGDLGDLLADLRGESVERARRLIAPPAPAERRPAPAPRDPLTLAERAERDEKDRQLVTFARAVILVVAVVAAGVATAVNGAGADGGSQDGDGGSQVEQVEP